jgi:hypothetical protein
MLPFEKLDAAHELCHVLMWDNPTLANQFFAAFKATVDDDVSECFALSEPLRTALRSVLVYREWDELDLMLDDLQEQVRRRRLAIRFNEPTTNDEEEDEDEDESVFNFEDTDEFFAQVNDVLIEDGFNLWSWETESGALCVFIAPASDRETIYHLAYTLGFHDDSGAALRCCDVVG